MERRPMERLREIAKQVSISSTFYVQIFFVRKFWNFFAKIYWHKSCSLNVDKIDLQESDLNYLLREKEVSEQNYNIKQAELFQQSRMAQTGQRATELMREMIILNNNWRRQCDNLNTRITHVRQVLYRLNQQQ